MEMTLTPTHSALVSLVLGATVAHQAIACWRTITQTDDNGNPIHACDEAQPAPPPNMCAEIETTMNDKLTFAQNGFPYGGTGAEMGNANCQKSWYVDGDGDGQCNDIAYTSVSVAITKANTAPCPATEPPGGPIGVE